MAVTGSRPGFAGGAAAKKISGHTRKNSARPRPRAASLAPISPRIKAMAKVTTKMLPPITCQRFLAFAVRAMRRTYVNRVG